VHGILTLISEDAYFLHFPDALGTRVKMHFCIAIAIFGHMQTTLNYPFILIEIFVLYNDANIFNLYLPYMVKDRVIKMAAENKVKGE